MKQLAMAAGAWIQDLVDGPRVFDHVLPDPDAFRHAVLNEPAMTVDFGEGQTFHGIHLPSESVAQALVALVARYAPQQQLQVTFARQSPHGQTEPNYVHSDEMMGSVTGILYLNPSPAPGDGTTFWRHLPTGDVRGRWDEVAHDSHDIRQWAPWRTVNAAYNRLLLFQSDYFHSRALLENYGEGDDARLIQVLFLTDRPTLEDAA